MKTIVQCPTCKAIKFLTTKDEKVFWQPLTEPEFIAFEIMQSSQTLQIIVEDIHASQCLCPECEKQKLN